MISSIVEKFFSVLVCLTLLMLGVPTGPAIAQVQSSQSQSTQDQAATQSSAQSPPTNTIPSAAPLTSDQLDALVAPIALYPDSLVAEVLGGATFPDQIAVADYWLTQNKTLTGTALTQAVDQQQWDNSVKALTQFPDVLGNMASNLVWTSSLGQAFHNQQSDVMAAVQVMRAKAQTAGTLQSTPQIKVVQQTPQTIVIQPANPQVVYVPQYNPTVVYGAPYVVPYYTPPVVAVGAALSFGAGIAIGVGFGGGVAFGGGFGGGFGWGFGAWGCNWGGGGGGNITINHNTYISNRSWHGGNTYNNYHPWGPGPHGQGPYGPHPYSPNGFGPNHGGYGPHGDGYQPNGGRNGDHGLIGGNGGVQHPGDTPNGGRNGDHGLIGGNGGVDHSPQSGGTPDGGHNGDRGLIGGNGGTQRPDERGGGERPGGNQWQNRGDRTRTETNRGRTSIHPENRPAYHPAPHRSSGGGGNRGGGGGGRRR
jgi:hypothetical protein